ncbi:hypothetical protein OE88DRAFT_1641148 [Heliocybe sulcata]|uniref:Uncharacterized protein n=1 Tax=Heliocybe sulcata TaxID=5364 RepID=A0A5C3NMX2_9AGAM|nr:hypothetical protein OE88DRAFT_1641148 [Heliocybe sulcata]
MGACTRIWNGDQHAQMFQRICTDGFLLTASCHCRNGTTVVDCETTRAALKTQGAADQQQVILEYLPNIKVKKSYSHRNGPQDVRGPGRTSGTIKSRQPSVSESPTAFTGIHDNRFRPQGVRGTGQYNISNFALGSSVVGLRAELPPTSPTSVRKPPTLPRATLTDDRHRCLL